MNKKLLSIIKFLINLNYEFEVRKDKNDELYIYLYFRNYTLDSRYNNIIKEIENY